jgi:hypothetical protein
VAGRDQSAIAARRASILSSPVTKVDTAALRTTDSLNSRA